MLWLHSRLTLLDQPIQSLSMRLHIVACHHPMPLLHTATCFPCPHPWPLFVCILHLVSILLALSFLHPLTVIFFLYMQVMKACNNNIMYMYNPRCRGGFFCICAALTYYNNSLISGGRGRIPPPLESLGPPQE